MRRTSWLPGLYDRVRAEPREALHEGIRSQNLRMLGADGALEIAQANTPTLQMKSRERGRGWAMVTQRVCGTARPGQASTGESQVVPNAVSKHLHVRSWSWGPKG